MLARAVPIATHLFGAFVRTQIKSFVAIPFPATKGFTSTCAPITVSPSTLITVGAGSSVAPAFPGAFSFFGLETIRI